MSSQDDALVGRVIADKFRIDKLVARGGFSAVYRGTHLGIDRPVAIKILEIDENIQATWIERFSREAKVVSQLSHPNTITIFDFGQVDTEFLFIIMEYVRGRSLSRYVKKFGPIPPERLARFAVQIARSLDEAHHVGIVHRDLKPSNIMVSLASSGEESIKVLDFGVAKILDPEPDVDMKLTQIGAFVGTPRYASPEQLRREELDHRSDIYGLGMIMWECLVGSPAVEATDYGRCLQAHLSSEKWRLPSGIDIPDALADIIHRCLEKERADRYISCGHVADALEQCMGQLQFGETTRLERPPHYELEFLNESSEFGAYLDHDPSSENPLSSPSTSSSQFETQARPAASGLASSSSADANQGESFDVALGSDEPETEVGPTVDVMSHKPKGAVQNDRRFDDDPFADFPDYDDEEDDFLAQFDDEEELPDDLFAPSDAFDDELTRESFETRRAREEYEARREREKQQAERDEATRARLSGHEESDISGGEAENLDGWEEGLDDDPFGQPVRDRQKRSEPKQRQNGQNRASRSNDSVRRTAASASRSTSSGGGSMIMIAAVAFVLVAAGIAFGIVFSLAGEAETAAPEVDYEEAAKAEVEQLLEDVDDPKPATNDGTPTISPRAITLALAEGGWRVSSMDENDLGSLKSTSMMVTKDEMAASITIYRTKSTNMSEELLAETRSPSEGITFGSTLVRVSPGPSRNQSGVTPVVSLLYEFKTMAREAADEARGSKK